MPAGHPTILILDDNFGDINLLATAWVEGRYDEAIGIHTCSSVPEATAWLGGGRPADCVLRGMLVDLMLYDAAGRSAVDVLGEQPALDQLPIISWTGIEVGSWHTERMVTARRVWKKPANWTAFADFTLRLFRAFTSSSPGPGALRSSA